LGDCSFLCLRERAEIVLFVEEISGFARYSNRFETPNRANTRLFLAKISVVYFQILYSTRRFDTSQTSINIKVNYSPTSILV